MISADKTSTVVDGDFVVVVTLLKCISELLVELDPGSLLLLFRPKVGR